MKNILLTIITLALSSATIFGQQTEIIEGKLHWSFWQFQGFYGEEDSIVQVIEEHIHSLARQNVEDEEVKTFLKEFRFLKANDLLYKPCKFLMMEKKSWPQNLPR